MKLLVPIGILTGFSFATKYTAFLAIPYALGFVAWKLWRARQPVLRHVIITALLALVFIAPWLVKNWIWADNPFSPFFNRLFPNQYAHVSFEDDLRKIQGAHGLASYRQIPLQITIRGDERGGMFGPLFLLAPLALLALRSAVGRQLWLAAIVFGLPFYANAGARFLIPAVPFISLALAMAAASASWILPMLVLAHAISCWPSMVNRYCAPGAWHLARIPPALQFGASNRTVGSKRGTSVHVRNRWRRPHDTRNSPQISSSFQRSAWRYSVDASIRWISAIAES